MQFDQTPDERLELIETFVIDNCLDCHDSSNEQFSLEDLELDAVSFEEEGLDVEAWEKVLRRVRSRQMPPPGNDRPEEEQYVRFNDALATLLLDHSKRFPDPGRVGSMRRLTRYEYANAIRDLVGVQIDAEDYLPRDESSQGFDNITVEELSPTAINRYLSAAQKISRLAIGGAGNGPLGVTFRVPADQSQEEHVEGLPFGTRGGVSFQHHFHRSGEYEIELKLTRDRDEKVEGLHRSHGIHVLIDRELRHEFTVVPPEDTGGGWENRDFTHSDSHLKTTFRVDSGSREIVVTFPATASSLVENKRQPFDASFNRHRHPRRTPAIYQVSLIGPLGDGDSGDSNSRRMIFGSLDGNESCGEVEAEEIIRRLTRRAYRRSLTQEDLKVPLEFYRRGAEERGFEYGIELALNALLVNPNFLLKIESDLTAGEGTGTVRELSPFELANRLSFFIWSSIPDEELLDLAESGELLDDEVLISQARRMLRDDRAEALSENFAGQWLHLRNLESITPDLRLYPDFDNNLRTAFKRETELLFAEVVKAELSVTTLIDSPFTFLNDRLARHYGIRGISGSEFRKVELPGGSKRGGILRHGSILMVTSYATRTSPAPMLTHLTNTTCRP